MARDDGHNSVIGEGSIFEGQFYIAGSIRIDGKFEGEIKTDDTLVIGETGKVKTNVHANNVLLAGTLIGDIHARNEVRVSESGKMLGDINSPVVHLSKGVIIKGSVNISGGNKKDIQKLVEESYGSSLGKEVPDRSEKG
jgi:cytoskeletal protein CcmA (bactofilin family)